MTAKKPGATKNTIRERDEKGRIKSNGSPATAQQMDTFIFLVERLTNTIDDAIAIKNPTWPNDARARKARATANMALATKHLKTVAPYSEEIAVLGIYAWSIAAMRAPSMRVSVDLSGLVEKADAASAAVPPLPDVEPPPTNGKTGQEELAAREEPVILSDEAEHDRGGVRKKGAG